MPAIAALAKEEITAKFPNISQPSELYGLAKELNVAPRTVRHWWSQWQQANDDSDDDLEILESTTPAPAMPAPAAGDSSEVSSEPPQAMAEADRAAAIALLRQLEAEQQAELADLGPMPDRTVLHGVNASAPLGDLLRPSAWNLPNVPCTVKGELRREIDGLDAAIEQHKAQIGYTTSQISAEQASIYPSRAKLQALGDRLRQHQQAMDQLFSERTERIRDGRSKTQREADAEAARVEMERQQQAKRDRLVELDAQLLARADEVNEVAGQLAALLKAYSPIFQERTALAADLKDFQTSGDRQVFDGHRYNQGRLIHGFELPLAVEPTLMAELAPVLLTRRRVSDWPSSTDPQEPTP